MSRSLLAPLTNSLRNLRYNYLFLPGLIAFAFAGLALATTRLDRTGGSDGVLTLFPAGPPAARAVLQTIATTVATVAGVAFSLTIVSLQLVSQQFTPRALRGFLGDRLNQTIAGVFVGVFIYCLVALRSVEEGEESFLPGLTLTLALALALVALALLLVFVHHMGHSIQVSNIAKRIADATLAAVENRYPSSYGDAIVDADLEAVVARWDGESPPTLVYSEEPGFVQSLDDIPKTIEGGSFRLELLVAPGDFVTPRHPIVRVWTGADPDECATAVRRAIAIAPERDLRQDVGYGVRQLADIAVKALSPSVNDPTTAATCIGYLQAILERIAAEPAPAPIRHFPDKDVTILMKRDTFSDYLEALTQIGRYASSDARAVDALLHASLRVAQAAAEGGAEDRARAAAEVGTRIARRALSSEAIDEEEREAIATVLEQFPSREGAVR
ncbi:MAG: DUF2254 domain-containing protein [Actinomycetota bacterium]|nr:DUF2254 domain-containing protein [Actinomycetota bacterium]